VPAGEGQGKKTVLALVSAGSFAVFGFHLRLFFGSRRLKMATWSVVRNGVDMGLRGTHPFRGKKRKGWGKEVYRKSEDALDAEH
jgi:hypothetical protein